MLQTWTNLHEHYLFLTSLSIIVCTYDVWLMWCLGGLTDTKQYDCLICVPNIPRVIVAKFLRPKGAWLSWLPYPATLVQPRPASMINSGVNGQGGGDGSPINKAHSTEMRND